MTAMANVYRGKLIAAELRFGIVVSRWNSFITEKMLEGALDAGEGVDQRRLAGTVRPDDAEQLARSQVDRDAGQRRGCAVRHLQVADFKHGPARDKR